MWANRLEKNPQDPEIILLPTAEIVGGKKTVHLEAVFGKAHLSITVEDDHKEFLHIPEFLIQSSSMKYPFVDVTNSGLGRLYLDQLKAISRLLQRPLKLEPSNENALRFYMKQGFSAFTKELDVYKKRDESLYHAHELSISQHDLNSLINYYKTEAKAIIDEAPEIEVTLEQALARAKIYDKLRPEFRLKNFFLDQISLIWDPEK